jgi:PAS domain S-box-containing protein
MMKRHNIGSLLVKDGKRVVGIFTERDLIKSADFSDLKKLSSTRVKDIMTRRIKKISHDRSYTEVIRLMGQNQIRHMPVVKNGKIIGIVSLRDLLMRYNEQLQNMLRSKEKKLCENIDTVRKSEERFRTIFYNSPLAMTLVDQNERLIAWNPSLEQLVGLKASELRDRPVQDLYPPEEWKRIRAKKIRFYGDKHFLETKVINGGQKIDVDVSISVLKDLDGVTCASIGIIRDISDSKKLEELKERFIALSHELRTPLLPIKEGISQVLEGLHGEISVEQRRFLTAALNEVNRLKRIIDDLLDVFKLEAGKITVDKQIVDVIKTINNIVSTFAPQAAIKKLKLEADFAGDIIKTYTDKDKLTQVLDNLVNNAIKFTRKGKILISVKRKGPDLLFSISDTGVGIERHNIADLFKAFKQIGRLRGEKSQGTGLGLAICKDIVEALGGKIWVKSKFGRGSTFSFTLPHYIPIV